MSNFAAGGKEERMHFSDAFLDEVVARNDIVDVVSGYVALTRKGGNLFGLCPFHSERRPRFPWRPASRSTTASAARRAAA